MNIELAKLSANIADAINDFNTAMQKAEEKLSQPLQMMPIPDWHEVAKREIQVLKADKIALKEGYDFAIARGVELVKESEAKSQEIARLNELLNTAHSDIDTYARFLKETQNERDGLIVAVRRVQHESHTHQGEKVSLREEVRSLRDRLQHIANALNKA